MDFFSNDSSSDKVRTLSSNLDSVKNIMKDNIGTLSIYPSHIEGKMLARGEAIETVLDKTETLKDSSDRFKSSASRLKRRMWWKNAKLWCVIAIVILVRWAVTALTWVDHHSRNHIGGMRWIHLRSMPSKIRQPNLINSVQILCRHQI